MTCFIYNQQFGSCVFGYHDDIMSSDIDECLSGDAACGENGDCENTIGSYTCKCNSGFEMIGTVCRSKTVLLSNVVYTHTSENKLNL